MINRKKRFYRYVVTDIWQDSGMKIGQVIIEYRDFGFHFHQGVYDDTGHMIGKFRAEKAKSEWWDKKRQQPKAQVFQERRDQE